jgi:hypothetical protein
VVAHVLGWARAWAPWMPQGETREIAERVARDPQKFTADVLAWRLRLSMVERTELKITTIGAFDCSKSDRAAERKRKKNEAKRIKRAQNSSGRPRGRPRKTGTKNAGTAVDAYAVPAFNDHGDAAPADAICQTPKSPDGATKPPADAVCTPQKSIGSRVGGFAPVDNSSQQSRSFKTRFPSAMRLNKEMRAFALEAGFTPDQIQTMFEMYRDLNIAQRTYSIDWTECWFKWVNRQATIVNAQYARDRARAYWESRS